MEERNHPPSLASWSRRWLRSAARVLQVRRVDMGMLLVAGFGAMLLLIAVSGLEAIRITEQIRSQEAENLTRYMESEQILSDIRVDLLWASTWASDFLQSRTQGSQDFYRRQLWGIRQELRNARTKQDMLPLTAEQTEIWDELQGQIGTFLDMIDPILEWTPWEKSVWSSRFLREQLLPRRTAILQMTDQLAELNSQVLANQEAEVREADRRFREMMVLRILLFLVAGAGVAIWTMRYARRLQGNLQAQYLESTEAKSNLQRLSAQLVHAQEEERRAISRELHDQIGQALTAIKVNLGMAEQKMAMAPADVGLRIRESKMLAEQTIQEIRDLSRLLRPSMLDDLGLVPALEWYVRSFSRRFGIPVHLKIDSGLGRLPEEWETCIYRSIQEALTNTMRHSVATNVLIYIEQLNGSLRLTVEDNGQGFEFASQAGGLGLIGMRERARELGGTLSVESKEQTGTRIRITLPQPQAIPPSEAKSEVLT